MKPEKEAVVARLGALADKEGRLTPEQVVEDARDPKSPLHPCFEWDDSKAAHQHRLYQARKLVAVYVTQTIETRQIRVPMFVRDPDAAPNAQGYVRTVVVKTEKERAREVLLDELGRVAAITQRARALAALFGLENEVDLLIDGVGSVLSRLEKSDEFV